MAKVYDRVNGSPLERIVALHEDTQEALRAATYQVAAAAIVNLANAKTHDPNINRRSEIRIARDEERPDIDWNVVLSDERGYGAAMSIEYGRKAGASGRGGSKGLWILHRAAGIPEGD